MSILWRNWPVHNLIGHPISEIAYWILCLGSKTRATAASRWIHDQTLPKNRGENV